MNRYYTTIIGLTVAILLVFSSCTKDLDSSNFITHPINDITIEGIQTRYTVELGSVLTIEPQLTFALGEASSTYRYGWFLVHSLHSSELLSEERNLVLPIEGTFGRIGRTFNLAFQITDLNTGVIYQRNFELNVRIRHQIGHWILHERENDFDITLLSPFQDSLFRFDNMLDVFDSALPRVGETPKALYLFANTAAPTPVRRDGSNYSAIIRTDRATNSIRSLDFGFEPEHYNISAFVQRGDLLLTPGFNPQAMTVAVRAHAPAWAQMYMYYNGNIHFASFGLFTIPFWFPINRMADENNQAPFTVSPFMFASQQHGAILFDKDNRRFVRINGTRMAGIQTPSSHFLFSHRLNDDPAVAPEDLPFSWTENIERLVYMGSFGYHDGFAIIKDELLGKYRWIEFHLSSAGIEKIFGGIFNDNAFVENIEFFARFPHRTQTTYLYVATKDNRVFRIARDRTAMNNPVEITNDVLQSGYRISTFDFIRFSNDARQHFLTVGSYNPAGPAGANGRVAMFNVQGGTGILTPRTFRQGGSANQADDAVITMEFTGLGRPVSIGFKGS